MATVEDVLIETPFGWVRGERMDGVACFRRLPYAAPCTGPNRFKTPAPLSPWTGVRDATVVGPIPPQLPSRLDAVMAANDARQDEDCLHVDIWSPHSANERAPVVVFIHGGAFLTGGGSLPCYDGRVLARRTGLVVVNITYRLGVLGFLPLPGIGAVNLGLHDQISALRWIQRAISSFGGDPSRVTVVGQSAGAFSIAVMLGAPIGAELFHQAIMMSNPLGLKLRRAEERNPVGQALLQALGLDPNESKKLRDVPVSRLLETLRTLQPPTPALPGDITPPFMPVIDGDLIPCDPRLSLQRGSAEWCRTIIGVTREEYASFLISNRALADLTEDQLLRVFESEHGDHAAAALEKARAQRAPATPRALLGDLRSDFDFIKPSWAFAESQSERGQSAYAYRFDWQSPMPGLGAGHCIDLPFLFGNMENWGAAPMLAGADKAEIADLSRVFQDALGAFATTGDPNGANLPDWPPYRNGRAVLHFDRRIAASGRLE